MSDLKKGMLVQHVSLGLGKVVALEADAVHVFFETSDKRTATKLRRSVAEPLLSPATTKAAWLKGMSPFSLDPRSKRYALADTWVSHDQAVARFTELFPKGFASPRRAGDGKKKRVGELCWAAHEAFVESLGDGEGARLLAGDDVDELVRRTLRLERHLAELLPTWDKGMLARGLRDRAAARGFFAGLFACLAAPAPERQRFEHFASAVLALPGRDRSAPGWPVVTVLPFIAQPDRHMLLDPKLTVEAAQRLGFELSYDAGPSWPTYSALLSFAALLLDMLAPIGARDFIDVHAFISVTATRSGRASGPRREAPEPPGKRAAPARRPKPHSAAEGRRAER